MTEHPLAGNDFAVGNSGGAPENNDNAVKHNLDSAPGKLYERLSETKRETVERIFVALLERYREFHGRDPDYADAVDLFELSMGPIQREFGREYMAEQWDESGNPLLEHVEYETDSGPVEFDKPNGILDKLIDSRREDRLMKKHMGLFRDADSKQAEANSDLAEAWRRGLEDAEEAAEDDANDG